MEDVQTSSVKPFYRQFLQLCSDSLLSKELAEFGGESTYILHENWGSTQWSRFIVKLETAQPITIPGNSTMHGNQDDLNEIRIRKLVPASPNEINSQMNPLEVNLTHLVSFKKGCYVGQEVIARLDTYDKVQQRLCAFTLTALPKTLPAPILNADQEVGTLTSSVYCRSNHSVIGLGFLKMKAPMAELSLRLRERDIKLELQTSR